MLLLQQHDRRFIDSLGDAIEFRQRMAEPSSTLRRLLARRGSTGIDIVDVAADSPGVRL